MENLKTNKNSKILLLDASGAATPIKEALDARKIEVFTIGQNKFQLMVRSNRNHIDLNYANIAKVQSFIDLNDIHNAIPGCTDVSFETYANLNLNQKSISSTSLKTIRKFLNKLTLQEALNEMGLPNAQPMTTQDALKCGDDILVKPADSYSGRGIIRIFSQSLNSKNLEKAISRAEPFSKKKQIILQRYIHGELKSFSIFCSP
jgi:glutathione synthase/RimK-type ligase-like ATP-grasp enzyme